MVSEICCIYIFAMFLLPFNQPADWINTYCGIASNKRTLQATSCHFKAGTRPQDIFCSRHVILAPMRLRYAEISI